MSDNRLKIGITQGDTNGIGWEVILKTLADSRIAELCTPVVYGSPAAAGYYRRCIADLEEIAFNTVSSARDARRGRVNLIACGPQELRIVPGEPSPEAGRAAVEALQAAVRDLKEGTLAGKRGLTDLGHGFNCSPLFDSLRFSSIVHLFRKDNK